MPSRILSKPSVGAAGAFLFGIVMLGEQASVGRILAAAINGVGFLGFYALYGNPAGALRTIAIADLVALPPLAFAAWMTIVRARIRTSMTESPGSMPYSRDSVSGTNTGATGIR